MAGVSIIIPVYKVEKYLQKCVDSVFAQTFTDFELLLVDDGTPDKSAEICDETALYDDRSIITHKKNTGASDTRNIGILNGCGTWITFIDSDDYVDSRYIEAMHDTNYDMIFSDRYSVDIKRNLSKDNYENADILFSSLNDMSCLYTKYMNCSFSPVTKLIRSSLIKNNNCFFPKEITWGEDAIFIASLFQHTRKIKIIDYAGYYYIRHDKGSLSTTVKPNIVDNIVESREYCLAVLKIINELSYENAKEFLVNDIEANIAYFVEPCINDRKKRKYLKLFLKNEYTLDSLKKGYEFYSIDYSSCIKWANVKLAIILKYEWITVKRKLWRLIKG